MKTFWFLTLAVLAVIRLIEWRDAKERAADFCALLAGHEPIEIIILGEASESPSARPLLSDPKWNNRGQLISLPIEVRGLPPWRGTDLGHQFSLSGQFSCLPRTRNPGEVADGLSSFQKTSVRLSEKRREIKRLGNGVLGLSYLAEAFRKGLSRLFVGAPGVQGFEEAIWTGSLLGLPPDLQRFYLETGLLQVLALSGQHVAAFCLVLQALSFFTLRKLARTFPRIVLPASRVLPYYKRALPLFCALFLWVTSQGAPSVQRTTAMAFSFFLLRWRGLCAKPLAVALSTAAIVILIEPALVVSPGFFLSAVATSLSCCSMQEADFREALKRYFFVSLVMPCLIVPVTAFLFAKVSWTAPLHNLLLGWLWDLVLIPLGFMLPVIALILPLSLRQWLLIFLERSWGALVDAHRLLEAWLGTYYRVVIRPTWTELLIVEAAIVAGTIWLARRGSRRQLGME